MLLILLMSETEEQLQDIVRDFNSMKRRLKVNAKKSNMVIVSEKRVS